MTFLTNIYIDPITSIAKWRQTVRILLLVVRVQLVKPEMGHEFEHDKCNWFPRTDMLEHAKYDKRTPGLFKVEWKGEGIISLCSKTYYCFGSGKDKFRL